MVNSRDYEPAEVASCELQLRESPNSRVHVSQCNQEGNTSFTTLEKAMEDGYNWRKYGQKLVKGNEFVRSYYKCTYSHCQVKKQLERSHDGKMTDTIYIGKHDHPKTLLSSQSASGSVLFKGERPDMASINSTEGKSFDVHGKASHCIEPPEHSPSAVIDDDAASESNRARDVVENDDVPDSKRWKKENDNVDVSLVDKLNGEPRVVVHTLSEVEIVNDGYRWRKYGQKLVKGNSNPRSYYRCSNAGCPVKKQVERASHDPKLLIATYEGQHDHNLPHARTVTHNPSGLDVNPAPLNNVLITKSEAGDKVVFDVVVHFSAYPESILQNKKQTPDAEYVPS